MLVEESVGRVLLSCVLSKGAVVILYRCALFFVPWHSPAPLPSLKKRAGQDEKDGVCTPISYQPSGRIGAGDLHLCS